MVSRFFAGSSKFRPRRKEGVCRGKESNIIQKRRKLFPRCESFPILHLRGGGNGPRRKRDVSRCSEELHLGDNFSNYYQMANGQSLCFSRAGGRTSSSSSGTGLVRLRLPTSRSLESRARRGRGLRAQYRADDKPSSGKSIFDRNAPCFPTTCTRSLRGQGFRTSSGGGRKWRNWRKHSNDRINLFLPSFLLLSFFLLRFIDSFPWIQGRKINLELLIEEKGAGRSIHFRDSLLIDPLALLAAIYVTSIGGRKGRRRRKRKNERYCRGKKEKEEGTAVSDHIYLSLINNVVLTGAW